MTITVKLNNGEAIKLIAKQEVLDLLDKELGALDCCVTYQVVPAIESFPLLRAIWLSLPTYAGPSYADYWRKK